MFPPEIQKKSGILFLLAHWLVVVLLIVELKLDASATVLLTTTAGLCLFFIFGLLHFHWLFLVYVTYLPVMAVMLSDRDFSYAHPHSVVELFLLASWFISRAMGRVGPYRPTSVDILVGLLVLLTVTSILWSDSTWIAVVFIVKFLLTLGGCFLATLVAVSDRPMLGRILDLTMALGVINSILCFFFVITYPNFESINIMPKSMDWAHFHVLLNDPGGIGKRGHGLGHPIYTSIWISFGIHIVLHKMLFTRGVLRNLAWLLLILFFLSAMQSSLSKGPMLALIPSFAAHMLLTRKFRGWLLTSSILLLWGVALGFVIGNSTDLTSALKLTRHQLSASESYSSTESRLTWWKQAVPPGLENGGMGVGAGNAIKFLDPKGPHPHSAYVSVLSELGYPGLLLYLGIVAWGLVHGLAAIRRCKDPTDRSILVLLFCWYLNVIFNILTIGSFQEPVYWYTLALSVAGARIVLGVRMAHETTPGPIPGIEPSGRRLIST
jgi:hypothetical protein